MTHLSAQWLATANAFIEDTSVIFAVAYLLSRGRTLESLVSRTDWRSSLRLGALLGLVAGSEVVFPGMRAPYVSHTLVICLATILGGWVVSVPAIAVVAILAFAIDSPTVAFDTLFALIIVAASSAGLDRLTSHSLRPPLVGLLGGASQGMAVFACNWFLPAMGAPHSLVIAPMSIPANAFGLFLAMLVVRDSDARAKGERHRLDLERFKVLLVSADLAALRARIRPHFLFNALTAIASLCATDAYSAERSILKLGRLLRRTLEVETTSLTTVALELEYLKAFIDIQILRFGDELSTEFDLAKEVMDVELPAFSLQTLVENAFQHGVRNRSGSGRVRILGRIAGRFAVFAVEDNGIGMDRALRAKIIEQTEVPKHGMGIIDKQVRLLYGPHSRLRIFSRPGEGTMIAFRVPLPQHTQGSLTA